MKQWFTVNFFRRCRRRTFLHCLIETAVWPVFLSPQYGDFIFMDQQIISE